MTTKELIRQKIDAYYTEYKAKFHQNGNSYHLGIIDGLDMAERILDTLPDEPVTDCNDLEEAKEEYIRKDALMEWLEGMMTKEGATEGFVGGYDFALKDVINKLNEL